MKLIHLSKLALLLCVFSLSASASDFTGVYARIDRVVVEPSADKPERIQIWGVFAIAQSNNPRGYDAPVRGYLYYTLPDNADAARREWNDLKQVAGTGEVVAFGNRGRAGRLRKNGEKPESPDPYATNVGVNKVRARTDYEPIRALLAFKD